jgi:hypothetical protein
MKMVEGKENLAASFAPALMGQHDNWKQNTDTILPAFFASSTAYVAAWISAVLLVRRPLTRFE